MLQVLLPLAFAWGVGLALALPALGARRLWLAFWSASGLGVGAVSLLYWWMRTLLPWQNAWLWAGLCLIPLAIALWNQRGAWQQFLRQRANWRQFGRQTLLLAAALLAISALALWRFAAVTRSAPDCEWDAIAIWNLHARFLFFGGSAWKDYFSIPYTHPDYPLLIPAWNAAGWSLLGRAVPGLPQGSGMLFLLASVGSLAGFVQQVGGWKTALLAGAVLLASPAFITLAAWQYADVPLAFYTLAAAGFLMLAEKQPASSRGMLVLSGFTAGLAVWTKNEGWSILLGLIFARLAWQVFQRSRLGGWGWFTAGLLPPVITALFFKWFTAPPGDLFSGRSLGDFAGMLFDFSRWGLIFQEYGRQIFTLGGWVLPVLLPLALYAALNQPRQDKAESITWLAGLPLLFIQAQYLVIYLITPYPLAWHLQTSLDRLLIQTFPAFLFWFFLVFPYRR